MSNEKINHKWDENNVCVNCGLKRQMRSWKRLMAMVGSKDYYQYGRSWYYGFPHKEAPYVIRGIGFKRPNCKK